MIATQQFRIAAALTVSLLLLAESSSDGQDRPGVWTLDIKFSNPEIMKVDIPGRGERRIWYVEYEIANKTKEARHFVPDFRLVTDKGGTDLPDEILPQAQAKLRRGGLKNSVTASLKAIPVGGKIQGVAMWDGIDPTATRFTLYLRGLSNGFKIQDKTPKYKTLRAKFERVGNAGKIRPSGAHEWIYRESATAQPQH